MATSVPMGIVSLKAEGAYAADKLYKKGMWVTSSGSSYAYINPTPATGAPLTDTTHWQQIATVGGQELVDAAVAARDAAQGYAAQLAAGLTSPGVYATFAALVAAKPTGDTKIYVVTADGFWYYWDGSAWVAGGVYQSSAAIAALQAEKVDVSFIESSAITLMDWEAGRIDSATGANVAGNKYIRSSGYHRYQTTELLTITPSNNIAVGVKWYLASDLSYVSYKGQTATEFTQIINPDYVYRFQVSTTDESDAWTLDWLDDFTIVSTPIYPYTDLIGAITEIDEAWEE